MAVKGRIDIKIDLNDVWQKTTNGYDIYRFYEGTVKRLMACPWRKDRKHSFGIYYGKNGLWMWKDLAEESTGTAIHYVCRKFNLSFNEAFDKICWDFGIGEKLINTSPAKITWAPPLEEDKSYIPIAYDSCPFKKHHHEFWNAAEVTEQWCKQHNCEAVKDLAIRRRKIHIGENEPVFAYYCEEENAAKIYFPHRKGKDRFRNNVSYRHLWNFSNLTPCENLLVQKSNKDMIVSTLIHPYIIATQAEAVKIFDEETVGKINNIAKNVFIGYGSDADGKKKSTEITKAFGYQWFNTPNSDLPDINDTYGYVKKYGLRELEKLFTNKNII